MPNHYVKDRIQNAAVEGLVIGVKWGVVFVVLAIAVSILLGDYAVTRNNANFAANVLREMATKQAQESK